jgi:hypothetical protein
LHADRGEHAAEEEDVWDVPAPLVEKHERRDEHEDVFAVEQQRVPVGSEREPEAAADYDIGIAGDDEDVRRPINFASVARIGTSSGRFQAMQATMRITRTIRR